jgi:phosphonate transport system substrate-binding protein
MHRLLNLVLMFIFAISAWPASADVTTVVKTLEIGVVPYMSPRVLVASYEPMRLYLEQHLGKPVKIYTSSGFKPFLLNAQRGDYDLVISPAHFARILQTNNRFTPFLRYSSGGRGLVMTALDSPIKTPQDLRGKIIALPDQLSLASIVCMTHLGEDGLKPGTDFHLLIVPSFAAAILAVQKGDALAAVSAPGALVQMAPELRASVRPVLDTGDFINLIYLAHPRLGKTTVDKLNHALLKFGNDTSEGKQFFSSTGFGSFVPATAKEMNSLDRYVAETKRLLDESQ